MRTKEVTSREGELEKIENEANLLEKAIRETTVEPFLKQQSAEGLQVRIHEKEEELRR